LRLAGDYRRQTGHLEVLTSSYCQYKLRDRQILGKTVAIALGE
jgi:hypothetical protein